MKTKQQKALAERRIELRLWKLWRRERLEALLNGRRGGAAQALLKFLKTMSRPSQLVDFIAAGPWSDADANVRFEVLVLVDAVVVKRRERMGLPPFDDALPGQPDNLFLLLRELLAPPSGAQPGLINTTSQNQENSHVQQSDNTARAGR